MEFITGKHIGRRTFLKGLGATVGLPYLDAMRPAGRMSAALAKRFDCEVELHNEVDAGVMGGAVIYAGDEVIDGSLIGRLTRLESSLV